MPRHGTKSEELAWCTAVAQAWTHHTRFTRLSDMFNDTYTSLCFKLRPLVPCTVCSLKTRLDLLPDGAVELLLVGTHPGLLPTLCAWWTAHLHSPRLRE